jgi:hypothetical protein
MKMNFFNPRPLEPNWINNRFASYSELFPNWIIAEHILTELCETVDLFSVTYKYNCAQNIEIDMVVYTAGIPSEYHSKVIRILNEVQRDYLPSLDCFLGYKACAQTYTHIQTYIKDYEQHLIAMYRARSVKDELKFRLGLLNPGTFKSKIPQVDSLTQLKEQMENAVYFHLNNNDCRLNGYTLEKSQSNFTFIMSYCNEQELEYVKKALQREFYPRYYIQTNLNVTLERPVTHLRSVINPTFHKLVPGVTISRYELTITATSLKEIQSMKTAADVRRLQAEKIPQKIIDDIEKLIDDTLARYETRVSSIEFPCDLSWSYLKRLEGFLKDHGYKVEKHTAMFGACLKISW